MAARASNNKRIGAKEKHHSEFEKAAGIILLARNSGNIEETAKQLNIDKSTLHRWIAESETKKEALPILLEQAIKKMLDMMPDKWTGNSWAIAFGIMMDKWLLVNGQPTARTEQTTVISDLDQMNDKEKDAILTEAERIIREAISGRPDNQETS
jgi:transposase-like protein